MFNVQRMLRQNESLLWRNCRVRITWHVVAADGRMLWSGERCGGAGVAGDDTALVSRECFTCTGHRYTFLVI
jgi:hypothetical protein